MVYRNSTRKIWSVKHKGKVIGHERSLTMVYAEFRVSEAGRQRVIRTSRKNVHAGVHGDAILPGSLGIHLLTEGQQVRYNPYKGPHFVTLDGSAVFQATLVYLADDGKAYIPR